MAFLDKLLKFKKKPFGGEGHGAKGKGQGDMKDKQGKSVAVKSPKPLALSSMPHGSGKFAHVIIRPRISEKTAGLQISNQYVFDVDIASAKHDVACAVQDVYGIKPLAVRIVRASGKKVRFGRTTGNTKAWKKAIVTLPAGKTIDVYKK